MSNKIGTIANRDDVVAAHLSKYVSEKKPKTSKSAKQSSSVIPVEEIPEFVGFGSHIADDDELIAAIKASGQGEKFTKLFDGDCSEQDNDHSRADMAMVRILIDWVGSDVDRIDRLFRRSELMRNKWDRKQKKSTYGLYTIYKGFGYVNKAWEEAVQELDDLGVTVLNGVDDRPKGPGTSTEIVAKLQAENAGSHSFNFVALSDIKFNVKRPYLVKGYLLQNTFASIYGAPGAGKTYVALAIGFSVAQGIPIAGNRTTPGVVFYIAAEGEASVNERINAICVYNNIDRQRIPFHLLSHSVDLSNPERDLQKLIAAINRVDKQNRPVLIIIDTFARVTPGVDENSSKDVGLVIKTLQILQSECVATVLAIHHLGKDESKGPRGSTAFMGALDTGLVVTNSKTNGLRLYVDKERAMKFGSDIPFELHEVDLGLDDDNEPLSDSIVRFTNDMLPDIEVDPTQQLKPHDRVDFNAIVESQFELFELPPEKLWGNVADLPPKVVTSKKLIKFLQNVQQPDRPDIESMSAGDKVKAREARRKRITRSLAVFVKEHLLGLKVIGKTKYYWLKGR